MPEICCWFLYRPKYFSHQIISIKSALPRVLLLLLLV